VAAQHGYGAIAVAGIAVTAPRAMAPTERIARALAALGEWRLLRALPGGNASDSWLVEAEGRRLVVRTDRPLARALGLDREAEWEVLRAVGAAGLGPAPVLRDPGRGVLVTEYLGGHPWSEDELADASRLNALGRGLRAVHEIPFAGKAFDPVATAEGYARAAGAGHAELLRCVQRLAGDLYDAAGRRCLCHHDPHAGNVIDGADGRLRFIDWEYAAVGDPLFDLAVVVRHHQLAPGQARLLLQAWSGGDDPALSERLENFGRLYDALAALWEQVVSRHG
jgi:thiamine kinase